MRRSVPVSAVPEFLGCKRPQVAQLIAAGILQPIAGSRDGRRSVSQGIDSADLDSFVSRLRSRGQAVQSPSEGMTGIVKTAETLRVPAVKIVGLLLQGSLTKVELLDEELRYQSVFLDEGEVGRKLGQRTGLAGHSITATARKLGLSAASVGALLRTPSGDLDPILKVCGQSRHFGHMREMVDLESVDQFKTRYLKISEVAANMSTTVPEARKKLKAKGAFPVCDPKAVLVELYRSSDI